MTPTGGPSGCAASEGPLSSCPTSPSGSARSGPPIALVAESGGRREDRQKWILEGWSGAIYAGQYSAVLYDCANDSVARWIHRLAKKARLARSDFNAVVQPRAEEIAALAPAADNDAPA